MKETRFIKQNETRWAGLEELIDEPAANGGKQGDLFVQIADDLSYARTYYPNRLVRAYLNGLAQRIFSGLLKTDHAYWKGMRTFWFEELPATLYLNRKMTLVSFILFSVSFLVGAFSSAHDPDFAAAILGQEYVEMTKENISNGDPMAVYKDQDALMMFLRIFWNNFRVVLLTFVFGLCFSIGTLGILVYNGIMVGTFQYFFFSKGLFTESFLSIWMHGTIEISCIILSGAAGLVMGNGLVYPGTYTRLQSLRISARSGIRMMAGIVPFVFVAAWIESYFTRMTELDNRLRLLMILIQALFILVLFVWLPFRKGKKGIPFHLFESQLPASVKFDPLLYQIKQTGQIFGDTFRIYGKLLSKMIGKLLLVAVMFSLPLLRLTDPVELERFSHNSWYFNTYPHLFDFSESPVMILLAAILLSLLFTWFGLYWRTEMDINPFTKSNAGWTGRLYWFAGKWAGSVLINLLFFFLLLPDRSGWIMLVFPALFFLIWNIHWQTSSLHFLASTRESIRLFFVFFLRNVQVFYSFLMISALFLLLTASISTLLQLDMLNWLYVPGNETYTIIFYLGIILKHMIALVLILPLFFISTAFQLISLEELHTAGGLRNRLKREGLLSET